MTRARSIAGEKTPITGPSESGAGPVSRRSRKKEKTRRNIFSAAMGLFAAIPAVIAYNRYSNNVERLITRYEIFVEEFSSIVQRQAAIGSK